MASFLGRNANKTETNNISDTEIVLTVQMQAMNNLRLVSHSKDRQENLFFVSLKYLMLKRFRKQRKVITFFYYLIGIEQLLLALS